MLIRVLFFTLFIFNFSLFASFENDFKELEIKKEEIINNYKIRVELARIENKKLRYKILNNTLKCIKNARSNGEIDACKSKENAILIDLVNKDFDNSREFTIQRNRLLIEYKSKYLKTQLRRKKQVVNQTLKCIKNSRSLKDINSCKHYESVNLEKIFQSFDDNPRLKNIIDKDELINRYQIRVEMAKLDNDLQRVQIFSKTLKCFESSRTKRDIYTCKTNEKNRILELLKS